MHSYDSVGMQDFVDESGHVLRFLYTADDERLAACRNGAEFRITVRDFDGRVLREFLTPSPSLNALDRWIWDQDHVYAGGRIVASAREDRCGGTRHFHLDHLGSVRMITNQSRLRLGLHDYYPFGVERSSPVQEVTNFGYDRPSATKFTGHERDFRWLNTEHVDYLDYMHARYYFPYAGRFLSVDPHLDIKKNLPEPQRWNRYAYVTNNPIKYTDPDGRDSVLIVVSTGDAADEKAGHAAFWAGDNKTGFGISVFGGHGFDAKTPTPEALIAAYRKDGREVRTYVLATTPQEEAKMIAFMKADPNRAGIDDTKSIAAQNCSTAIANTLTAGGVIQTPGAVALEVTGTIYTPKGIERSTRGRFGALVDRLKAIRIFEPEKKTQ